MKPRISSLFLFLIITLSLNLSTTDRAFGREDQEHQTWSDPVNLSQSGSATDPAMVIAADGVTHVVWQDEFAGMLYSFFQENSWSQPVQKGFPFEEFLPTLIADQNGNVHAFWTDQAQDLFYSRVLSQDFGRVEAWSTPVKLAPGVIDLDVNVLPESALNVIYITTLDDDTQSAGVYHLMSDDGGLTWRDALPLYTSRYYRSLEPNFANIRLSATSVNSTGNLYAVWDNRALKRVFLSISRDGGVTWDAPVEIEGPTITTVAVDPFNILVSASEEHILLIWQAGLQSGFTCTQYYQWSDDGGLTWSVRQRMLSDIVGCAQENRLFQTSFGYMLLQTVIQDEVYFMAWNGDRWSSPQLQSEINGFTDPVTYDAVTFRCRQTVVQNGNRIFVVGCDTVGNGDIWIRSKILESIDEWFPPLSLWSLPTSIADIESEISSLNSIADSVGRFQVFWIQAEESNTGEEQFSIYSMHLEDTVWSPPARVLVSPDRMAQNLSLAESQDGKVYAVWNGGKSGEVYFSWANLALASSSFEWSDPVAIAIPQQVSQSPDIQVGIDGVVYIVFSIPINEKRGIYLVSSTDQGLNWSEPQLIIDGTGQGWEIVDKPRLGITTDGSFHLLVTRRSILADPEIEGLYYTRSDLPGQPWIEPSSVVDGIIPESWLVSTFDQEIHRYWFSSDGDQRSLFQNVSLDAGRSWGPSENLTRLGENPGPLSFDVDGAGTVNRYQIMDNFSQELFLAHQTWQGQAWSNQELIDLGVGVIANQYAITAGVDAQGDSLVVYARRNSDPASNEVTTSLVFLGQNQSVQVLTPEAPSSSPTPDEPVSTNSSPESDATEIPAPDLQPSPEVNASTQPQSTVANISGEQSTTQLDPNIGLVISGILAVLIAGIAIFIRLRATR